MSYPTAFHLSPTCSPFLAHIQVKRGTRMLKLFKMEWIIFMLERECVEIKSSGNSRISEFRNFCMMSLIFLEPWIFKHLKKRCRLPPEKKNYRYMHIIPHQTHSYPYPHTLTQTHLHLFRLAHINKNSCNFTCFYKELYIPDFCLENENKNLI